MREFDTLVPCAHETVVDQGKTLQRLFTMFPNSWPGAGLLLLRLAAAISLLIGGNSEIWGVTHGGFWTRFIAIGVGGLLLAGLWTPIAGVSQAIMEIWVVFSQGGGAAVHLPLAALGISLVMLGPGAWSVDARIFGRKRIDIRSR